MKCHSHLTHKFCVGNCVGMCVCLCVCVCVCGWVGVQVCVCVSMVSLSYVALEKPRSGHIYLSIHVSLRDSLELLFCLVKPKCYRHDNKEHPQPTKLPFL